MIFVIFIMVCLGLIALSYLLEANAKAKILSDELTKQELTKLNSRPKGTEINYNNVWNKYESDNLTVTNELHIDSNRKVYKEANNTNNNNQIGGM